MEACEGANVAESSDPLPAQVKGVANPPWRNKGAREESVGERFQVRPLARRQAAGLGHMTVSTLGRRVICHLPNHKGEND